MRLPALTAFNLYRLTGSADDFRTATRALADRVEAEGHSGVLSYRFFADAQAAIGTAVVDYADTAAWIGHHDIAMGWPEMQAMHRVARLEEVTFLGDVAPEIRDWIAASGLTATLRTGFAVAAGFVRDAGGQGAWNDGL